MARPKGCLKEIAHSGTLQGLSVSTDHHILALKTLVPVCVLLRHGLETLTLYTYTYQFDVTAIHLQ